MSEQTLARLSAAGGITCVAIGAMHALGGVRVMPGATEANATVDSQERFWGPIFGAWGLLLMRAGRQPADLGTIEVLSTSMLVGGAARVLSVLDRGRPHPFYVGLTAVEFAAPAMFLGLTQTLRRQGRAASQAARSRTAGSTDLVAPKSAS